jgi:hypothetical protein
VLFWDEKIVVEDVYDSYNVPGFGNILGRHWRQYSTPLMIPKLRRTRWARALRSPNMQRSIGGSLPVPTADTHKNSSSFSVGASLLPTAEGLAKKNISVNIFGMASRESPACVTYLRTSLMYTCEYIW